MQMINDKMTIAERSAGHCSKPHVVCCISSLELFNEFAEAANMNKTSYPWADRRKSGEKYSMCLLTGAKGHEWWRHYIGVEFLARLKFRYNQWTKQDELYEVEPVRLTNTMSFRGRSINASCVALI